MRSIFNAGKRMILQRSFRYPKESLVRLELTGRRPRKEFSFLAAVIVPFAARTSKIRYTSFAYAYFRYFSRQVVHLRTAAKIQFLEPSIVPFIFHERVFDEREVLVFLRLLLFPNPPHTLPMENVFFFFHLSPSPL